jgi:hypothetical protein
MLFLYKKKLNQPGAVVKNILVKNCKLSIDGAVAYHFCLMFDLKIYLCGPQTSTHKKLV